MLSKRRLGWRLAWWGSFQDSYVGWLVSWNFVLLFIFIALVIVLFEQNLGT